MNSDPTDTDPRHRLELIDLLGSADGQDWPHFWHSADQRQIAENMYGKQADEILASSWYAALTADRAERLRLHDQLAEAERIIRRQLGECTGCTTEPEETCPRDGRSYTEWVNIASDVIDQLAAAARRMREAEKKASERIVERELALIRADRLEGVVARITAPETLRQITAPIFTIRHALPCSMRKAIYDGARCDCDLETQIAKNVTTELRAVLAAPLQAGDQG